MGKYAESTTVSTESSRNEIERTLIRYGAKSFVYGMDGALADGEVLGPVPTLRVYVSPFKIHSPSGAFGIGLFVRDPEGALLLKPTTLPGQDSLISDAYREGYGAALIEMLSAVIPGDKA